MGALITFSVLKKKAIFIGPSSIFWNIGHSPLESPLQTPPIAK
jgi:hypothetical protein